MREDPLKAFEVKPFETITAGGPDPKKWHIPKRLVNGEREVCGPGTRVLCPNPLCRAHVATFKGSLYTAQELVPLDILEFVSGQERKQGEKCRCKRCGTAYMDRLAFLAARKVHGYARRSGVGIRVHTEHGWI